MVDKHLTVYVVTFVLYNPRKITLEFVFVLSERFVQIFYLNFIGAWHFFVDFGYRQTTFFVYYRIAVTLCYLSIYKDFLLRTVSQLREIPFRIER